MKKLILVLLLVYNSQIFSQNISNKSIEGIWEVIEVKIDSKIFNNIDSNKIDLATSFFKTTNFEFSKNGLTKIQTKEKAPNPFNNMIFNTVFYFNTENNIISIGNRKKSSNILYIQVKQEKDFLYFNLIGALLKIRRIENSTKLKIDKDLIKSPINILDNKPLLHENIHDDEIISDGIDEFIKTYNCAHIKEKSALKKCVSETISSFFNRKFNPEIASDLGLSGLFKNNISFIINKEGNIVNIKAESKNPELSNEITQTVNMLPNFIPAKQNGNNINTQYSFPFVFQIVD